MNDNFLYFPLVNLNNDKAWEFESFPLLETMKADSQTYQADPETLRLASLGVCQVQELSR
jgi:hypothetical protein